MNEHWISILFFCTSGASLGTLLGQAWPENRGLVPRLAYAHEVTRFAGILALLISTVLLVLVVIGIGTSPGQRTAEALVEIRRLVGSDEYPGPVTLEYTGTFLDSGGLKLIENDILPYLPKHVDVSPSGSILCGRIC